MIAPARGTLRAARAAAVAGTVLALASAAHVAAGGGLPDALTALALLVLTACAAHLLTRRRLSGPALLGVLGTGQVALHEVLAATCAVPAGALAGTGHHGQPLLTAPAADTATAAAGATGWSLGMLAAHTAATLLAALVLARGEAALWALRAWWRPLLVVLRLAVPPPRGPRRTPPPAPPAVAAPSLVVVRRAPRRGPPPRRPPSPPRARSLAASP